LILVDKLFLLHFLWPVWIRLDRFDAGGVRRREQLEAMLQIMAESDDNGCQKIGNSKAKVISFYLARRESVEDVGESVVEGESAGVQKDPGSLGYARDDTWKVRGESHKEKRAADAAAAMRVSRQKRFWETEHPEQALHCRGVCENVSSVLILNVEELINKGVC
jgi:hypothetical protein